MTASYNFYRVEKKEQVSWGYLNRPDKKNAMSIASGCPGSQRGPQFLPREEHCRWS